MDTWHLYTYHASAREEGWLVREALEERLLRRRRAGSKLIVGKLREVAGQEAGPDGVGVRRGAEGLGDGGRAAGIGRRREGDHRREEILR
jgi:hypothetical protein